jgi:hypothetical protein
MSTVVLERRVDYFGPAGVDHGWIRVLAPEMWKTDWACRVQLSWPGYAATFKSHGVDPWQALHLALQTAPSQSSATDDFNAGKIGLWGKAISSSERLSQLCDVKETEVRLQ